MASSLERIRGPKRMPASEGIPIFSNVAISTKSIGSATNSESPPYFFRVPVHPFNTRFYRKPHRQTSRLQEWPTKVWYHERNHDVQNQPLQNHYWRTMRYRHNVLVEDGRYPHLARLPSLDPSGGFDCH